MENKERRKRFDLKKAAKKAGHAAAGAGLAVSMFLGSLFSSPAEIIEPEEAASSSPPAVVQIAPPPDTSADFCLDSELPEEETKRTWKDRVKAYLLRLPVPVRILFLLPMWAVGFAILWVFSALGSLMGVPIVGGIIRFIIGALVVFGLIVLGEKLMFPDVPLKKLVSGKNVIPLAAACGVIALAGALGGELWKDKQWITAVIDAGAAALYIAYFLIFIKRPERKAI
ncbi:MAG: hypothetical protein IKP26_06335 [Clostridia bacterium]|nr:hypothetical protein [Clostridia bacterium]